MIPKQRDWASAIGDFILNYGVLDWHVFVFLESRMPPEEFARIKKEHFQDRIARVKELVKGENRPEEQKRAFVKFFARLDPVRELRNRIAHGHLFARLGENGKSLVITLSLPQDLDQANAPQTRHLEFSELSNALGELSELIEEFQKLSGGWFHEQVN